MRLLAFAIMMILSTTTFAGGKNCKPLAERAAKAITELNAGKEVAQRLKLSLVTVRTEEKLEIYTLDYEIKDPKSKQSLWYSFEVVTKDLSVSSECLVYKIETVAFGNP